MYFSNSISHCIKNQTKCYFCTYDWLSTLFFIHGKISFNITEAVIRNFSQLVTQNENWDTILVSEVHLKLECLVAKVCLESENNTSLKKWLLYKTDWEKHSCFENSKTMAEMKEDGVM